MGQGRPRPITEVDVALLVPAATLERGRDYLGLGRVRDRARSGTWIGARVDGGDTYRVRASLASAPATDCTCPVRRQPCKHAAALLLAWAQQPDTFTDLDALAAGLKASPDALAAAFRESFLAGREPDLDAFLHALAATMPPTWRTLPLDVLLEAVTASPAGEEPGGEAALWRDAFERVGREASASPDSVAATADRVWRRAALALWATRLGGEPVQIAVSALIAALEEVPAAFMDGEAAGRRRRAFDCAARVACRLERSRYGAALRILRGTWRLLPAGENAARWTAIAAGEAEAARAREIGLGDAASAAGRHDEVPGARSRRESAVRALAAGWTEAGHPERAHAAWELHGDLDEADEGRVRAWMAAGAWERARDAARASLERAPARMVPWFRRQLALAHARLGEPAAALPFFAANFAEVPSLRAYRDLRDSARLTGGWEDARAEAAERLARSTWPAPGNAASRPAGAASPAQGGNLAARAEQWRAVAETLAEDAPLLALRYLAAAILACRRRKAVTAREGETGESEAGDSVAEEREAAAAEAALLACGEALARQGGARRVRAWRVALAEVESDRP